MGKPSTTKDKPPKELTVQQIESQPLNLEAMSITKQIERELEPKELLVVKRIAYLVGTVGLSLEESCTLIGIEYKKFVEQIKLKPVIKIVIQMKELQYKKGLLATLSAKGRGGDDKIATWLLERKYPDEFGARKTGEPAGGEDMLAMAIEFVQENPVGGLVQHTSGKAIIVKQKNIGKRSIDTTTLLKKVNEIAEDN